MSNHGRSRDTLFLKGIPFAELGERNEALARFDSTITLTRKHQNGNNKSILKYARKHYLRLHLGCLRRRDIVLADDVMFFFNEQTG